MIEILQLVALVAAVVVNMVVKKPVIKCEVVEPTHAVQKVGTPST